MQAEGCPGRLRAEVRDWGQGGAWGLVPALTFWGHGSQPGHSLPHSPGAAGKNSSESRKPSLPRLLSSLQKLFEAKTQKQKSNRM